MMLVGLLTIAPWAWGAPSYNRDIRPILSENCFYCHGQDPNHRKAGLRLDRADGAMKAVKSGEIAIVPGDLKNSALIERINSTYADDQMPPPDSNRMLSAEQKKTLAEWIKSGAKYEEHWAYIAPVKAELPVVKNAGWVRNPIDRFVLAKLEAAGMEPAPEADRATLIRRLYDDLIGLPPTPAEVDAFVADQSPNSYENLVDKLLASEHYGERMALPWLDAARYADSNGFQQEGDTWQWVWRDWVVKALNRNEPFDQFSIEQLAGDLLPHPTPEQMVATAFNRNHLLNGEGGAIPEEQRFNNLFDRVDTTATTWLGLTVACAQCHDHKYDPITQRDYYSLLAAFNNVSETGLAGNVSAQYRPAEPTMEYPTDEAKRELVSYEAPVQYLEQSTHAKRKFELALAIWEGAVTPETKTPDGRPLVNRLQDLRIEPGKRTAAQKKKLHTALRKEFEKDFWPTFEKKDEGLSKLEEAKKALAKYKVEEFPRVMVMRDDKPRQTFILDRGSYEKPTPVKVQCDTPAFLPPMPKDFPHNRLGIAKWLFLPDNPLTARVQVNRMWQLFFGKGLVKTPEDMGVQSEYPVHRELLDWLAVEFRESGWDMKHMHRLIVTSATYRQSSRVTPLMKERDPENKLISRAGRFRMPAMILRDVALSASGLIDLRVGGKPVYPYQPAGAWDALAITKERDFTYPTSSGRDLYRRSLYTFWRRTVQPADMFDASTRQTCKVRQSITCTPLHALTTLNDVTWVEAARVLAAHAMEAKADDDGRLTFAFRRICAREPTAKDLAALHRALDRQRAIYKAAPAAAAKVVTIGNSPHDAKLDAVDHASYTAVCLAILNLDEALTRE